MSRWSLALMHAKSESAVSTPDAPAASPPAAPILLLEEFCQQESTTANQVEMLAAFYADEVRQKHLSATQAVFAKRLAQFRSRPVE
jgi:hypothetical protein